MCYALYPLSQNASLSPHLQRKAQVRMRAGSVIHPPLDNAFHEGEDAGERDVHSLFYVAHIYMQHIFIYNVYMRAQVSTKISVKGRVVT